MVSGKIKTSVCICLLVLVCLAAADNIENRKAFLKQLKDVLPKDRQSERRISPIDKNWTSWQKRTGELPPDFNSMPSLPFLPEPLILDEGGKNIPIETSQQWQEKRQWIKQQVKLWISGTFPPAPENLKAEIISEKIIGQVTERVVLLSFGPEHKAKLHLNLLIPASNGPFPVFLTQWKKELNCWAHAAIARGYMVCRYTATDPKYGYEDDAEKYLDIWYPQYDFSCLMRWAWAASRAVDHIYTLEMANKKQIGITGLSRNGKASLLAAAFDERITAAVPVSGLTGESNPYRYTSEKYNNESIEAITRNFPNWFHPRLRFFVGREHKLPVDQNLVMALVAPRHLMLASSFTESQGNPLGVELAYKSAKKAYDFLGAGNNIAIDLRFGYHKPAARDYERFLDFFDYAFNRGNIRPANKLYYDYSFEKWKGLSKENIEPAKFPAKTADDLLKDSQGRQIITADQWQEKRKKIKENISFILGNKPDLICPDIQADALRSVINLNWPEIKAAHITKDLLFGRLYIPKGKKNCPVIIYLHEYAHTTGCVRGKSDMIDKLVRKGFAVYIFDQIGYGTRMIEGRDFYNRWPRWSEMGRTISDVKFAIDELSKIESIDSKKIFIAGYSLGATVALYSAATDERIAGVISVCGFTPLRTSGENKDIEGVKAYSHLHGLIPRLGFFIGHEKQVPVDFDEIIASIAPRPVAIIAPKLDRDADIADIKKCCEYVGKVYQLLDADEKFKFYYPHYYNRFYNVVMEDFYKALDEIF
ncbi:MAG: dienelactone hydrolase family protein [Planctomycetes bacterium]|nr:dienelactone hydrolase family protein [Planctomycetota bacterium]